jgi:uncharacterized membrane protein
MQNKRNDHPGKGQPPSRTEEINPIVQNLETVADIHKHAERKVSRHQRAIESVTKFLGRPLFLFLILLFVTLWVLVNLLLVAVGQPGFDPPPFTWLQGMLTLSALLQATVILITQNREEKMTQRYRQLDLQVGLLLDQKMSKLIEMIEELPQTRGEQRHDPQAQAMKEAVDPQEALSTLERLLEEPEEQ